MLTAKHVTSPDTSSMHHNLNSVDLHTSRMLLNNAAVTAMSNKQKQNAKPVPNAVPNAPSPIPKHGVKVYNTPSPGVISKCTTYIQLVDRLISKSSSDTASTACYLSLSLAGKMSQRRASMHFEILKESASWPLVTTTSNWTYIPTQTIPNTNILLLLL
jgi:hypothetical protein